MYEHIGSAPAVKVEIIVTAANGEQVHWEFDKFDVLNVDTMREPEYFDYDPFRSVSGGGIASISFVIERPGTYKVWMPAKAEQPAIDDGNVVEEAEG